MKDMDEALKRRPEIPVPGEITIEIAPVRSISMKLARQLAGLEPIGVGRFGCQRVGNFSLEQPEREETASERPQEPSER